VVFLACVHLALFLALSLSPDNSLVSSWCDHSMLAFMQSQSLEIFKGWSQSWIPNFLKPGVKVPQKIRTPHPCQQHGIWFAWWLSGRALDLRCTGRGFNSRLVRFHVIYVNSAWHPSGVTKSSTCSSWG